MGRVLDDRFQALEGNDYVIAGEGIDRVDGGLGDDYLSGGGGDDWLMGGAGQDFLEGGADDDTYYFEVGDGVDHINDLEGSNTLRFGPGVTSDMISLGLGSLVIKVGNTDDAIHLDNFDLDDPYGIRDIDTFEFVDATGALTSLSYETLIARDIDTIIPGQQDHAPVLTNALIDQSAHEDAAFTYTVPDNTFSDADGAHTLSYSATHADGSPLPTWLSFDAAHKTLSGIPSNDNVGGFDFKITATDSTGASASDAFLLTVNNTI